MRIGVDIGGTTVKIGLVDDYKVIDSFSIKTTKLDLFDNICNAIKHYINDKKINIDGIGFGIPGNVRNNYIINMPNIGIENYDLGEIIKSYFGDIKYSSNNDANCAALGESLYSQKYKSIYMITLGTGVGGGYVLDGRIIDGCNNAAGEIGHLYVDALNEFTCSCGLKGCLETVASATGIVRLAKKYYNDYETTLPFEMTCEDIFNKAKEDDKLALFIVDMFSKYLARGLSMISVTTDVECFYIGGGVSLSGNFMLDRVKKYYSSYAHYATKNTPIVLSTLENTAGILGAAYLF